MRFDGGRAGIALMHACAPAYKRPDTAVIGCFILPYNPRKTSRPGRVLTELAPLFRMHVCSDRYSIIHSFFIFEYMCMYSKADPGPTLARSFVGVLLIGGGGVLAWADDGWSAAGTHSVSTSE